MPQSTAHKGKTHYWDFLKIKVYSLKDISKKIVKETIAWQSTCSLYI